MTRLALPLLVTVPLLFASRLVFQSISGATNEKDEDQYVGRLYIQIC